MSNKKEVLDALKDLLDGVSDKVTELLDKFEKEILDDSVYIKKSEHDKILMELQAAHEKKITDLNDEISSLTSELEEEPEWDTVDLGYDRLYFKFEKRNLVAMQRIEKMLNLISSVPNKVIELS